MRNLRKLLTVFCVLCLVACHREEVDALPDILGQLGTEYGLQENQKLILENDTPQKIEVQLTRIQDGRCPVDVRCFTAGSVDVTATINFSLKDPQTVKLCLGECLTTSQTGAITKMADSAYFMIDMTRYLISLKNVDPYPVWKSKQAPSTAFILIEKRP